MPGLLFVSAVPFEGMSGVTVCVMMSHDEDLRSTPNVMRRRDRQRVSTDESAVSSANNEPLLGLCLQHRCILFSGRE